eukprot:scaffold69935_cov47-Phaeocystis_antarctica.AAC.2
MASAGKAAPMGMGLGGWVGLVGREDAGERACGRVITSESGLHARSAASRVHPPPTVGATKWSSTAMAAWGPGQRLRLWDLAQAESPREGPTSRSRVVGGLMRPRLRRISWGGYISVCSESLIDREVSVWGGSVYNVR